jgi:hypothetical protein
MNNETTPPELPTRWVKVTHHSPGHLAERYAYAGYGSNLWIEQVSRRCPEADIIGAGHVPDCQLRFAYYATIKETVGCTTPVAVYRLNPRDIFAMDRFEGLGRSYDRYLVTVTMADGTRQRCFTYVKRDDKIEPPSQIYYKRIEDGYRDWRFDLDILRAARSYAERNGRKQWHGGKPANDRDWSRWEPMGHGYHKPNYWQDWQKDRDERRRKLSEIAKRKQRDGAGRFVSLVTGRTIDRDSSPARYEEAQGLLPIEYMTDPARAAKLVEGQVEFTNPRTGERWNKGQDGIWRRVIES